MQEIRRFKPSTVSRRFSVTAGFYRTCVIDGLPEHSPAEHVRRPAVPAESPTLGFTHLQFEALLTTARDSASPCGFALAPPVRRRARLKGGDRRPRRSDPIDRLQAGRRADTAGPGARVRRGREPAPRRTGRPATRLELDGRHVL